MYNNNILLREKKMHLKQKLWLVLPYKEEVHIHFSGEISLYVAAFFPQRQ